MNEKKKNTPYKLRKEPNSQIILQEMYYFPETIVTKTFIYLGNYELLKTVVNLVYICPDDVLGNVFNLNY